MSKKRDKIRMEEWIGRKKDWEALPEDTRPSWEAFGHLWRFRRDTGIQLWDEHGRTKHPDPDEQRKDQND